MAKKRLTLIFIPSTNGQVREYRLASWFLWFSALALLGFLGTFGYYAAGYYTRVEQHEKLVRLREENDELMRHLGRADKEIAQLEGTMKELVGDDMRLRHWHEMDLEPISSGVGGPEEELPQAELHILPASKRLKLENLHITIDRLQREVRRQEQSFAEISRKFLDSEYEPGLVPTISPVDRKLTWKSSRFGKRIDPFTGRKAYHTGIDLAGRKGTPIYATADGEVIYAYRDVRLGNVVVIEHKAKAVNEAGEEYIKKGRFRTEYGHMERILVKKGEWVKRGQQIGLMGSTGRSTGPHLHYAVRHLNRRLGRYKGYEDPEDFLLDWPSKEKALLVTE